MAKEITVQDAHQLYEKFRKYTETAEQHQFAYLMIIEVRMLNTLEQYDRVSITNQKEARAMFRVVLKTIGEDASEYEEDEEV
jgi:hypothetical protein